jgi:sortase (surface protein transpeptidase)
MNNKSLRYALGALVVLLVSGSARLEAQSAALPRAIAYSEVTGTLNSAPVQSAYVPFVAPKAPATPTHITIASARVNADIIPIGVTKANNLDVPPNYYQAGWYKYGPIPGMPGNAVIDGHVDNASTIPGPFKHLRDAKIGDEIKVTMSDGSVVTFVVTDSSVYATSKFPSESVFHGSDASVLKIITCHGTFRQSMGTYDQRLIVTAVRKA